MPIWASSRLHCSRWRRSPLPALLTAQPALPSAPVVASGGGDVSGFDGVVQAVRQTAVAAQVAGAVVALRREGR